MLRALLKTRMQALFSYLFKASRNKGKSTGIKVLFALLMIYAFGCFGMMFGMMFSEICPAFCAGGLKWLYFSLAGITAFALCFIGSVFTAQVQLYEAKDNDLLLSMPIPPGFILVSRMVMLLILNYIFEAAVLIPAAIVYIMSQGIDAAGAVIYIIVCLFLPFLSLALSCIIGWVLALISSKVRNKSVFTTAASLLFLAAYFYGYSKVNEYIKILVANGSQIADAIKRAVPPAYHMGRSVACGSIPSLLIFLLWCILPVAVVYIVLSINFTRIVTAKKGFAKKQYKEKPMKVSSARAALIKKDLKHFASSSVYMMNAALGIVFTIAIAVAIILKQDILFDLYKELPILEKAAIPAGIAVLSLLATTNVISAPSISLEGKNLWIVQSIPVDSARIVLAKADMHIILCMPSVVFASVVFAIVLKANVLMTVFMIAVPAVITVLCALMGVAINLKFPKFDWINETVAVKQSASVMLSMLCSGSAVILPFLLYIILLVNYMSPEAFIGAYLVLLVLVCIVLYRWLKTRGAKIFQYL